MKKTNFTIHSLTRVAHWCLSLLLMFVVSSQASAQSDTCNLVCNDHVNASMPANTPCERTFVYQDFINNPKAGCAYTVELSHPYGTTSSPSNKVDRSHLGYTFIYSVKAADGNSCWGYVTIEDKAAPLLTVKNRKVSCFQLTEINNAVEDVIDNCSTGGKGKITSLTIAIQGNGCDSVFIAKVYRELISWDVWGNTTTAKDTLSITRDSIKYVKCPELVELPCEIDPCSGTTKYTFSSDKTSASYPSASLLLKLASDCRSSFKVNGLTSGGKIVPMICDSTFKIVHGKCVAVWDSFPMWSIDGAVVAGACKTTVGYTDEVITICGAGFKIRRQWRITNWCDNRDTVCVQWIKVEDKFPPVITGKDLTGVANPHDCYANITTVATAKDKCEGALIPKFIFTATDASGKPIIVNGVAGDVLKVAANPYGICPTITYYIADKCGNQAVKVINTICVEDVTPPTPVCDEFTRTTVDPATCWARVYAHDLDNGSRDNCCNVLHFAVAHMDTITAARKSWTDYWNSNCKADYWANKDRWDAFLEEYINCFIFKDYIDLTECGPNQVVLRVYEACGVPRFDPHVFKNCSSAHDWFTYNTYRLCRVWHNYQFFHSKGSKRCAGPAPVCLVRERTRRDNNLVAESSSHYRHYFIPKPTDVSAWDGDAEYFGASVRAGSCDFFYEEEGPTAAVYAYPPGNRCSERLYNDCMINITVDDKTLPVCEAPDNIYWYCDNAGGGGISKKYEYAHRTCRDWSYTNNDGDNIADYTCRDKNDDPYDQIECVKENGGTDDILDPTGREYGYYGCGTTAGHEDEHGAKINACDDNDYGRIRSMTEGNSSDEATIEANIAQVFRGFSTWAPVYCHSWLCVDKYDAAGKVDAKSAFWSPELHNLGKTGPVAKAAETGKTKFLVWDNCWINTTYTSKDSQIVDQCGNGWLSRTWTFTDKCVGTISCTQKIYTYHRSDFEVMFPQDLTIDCDATGGTSPDGPAGRPMVWDDECELVGVNFDDVRYDIIPDACYKIVRTWKLIDWCKYDPNAHQRYPDVIWDDRGIAGADRPCVFTKLKDNGDGYMTYVQIIKVIDTKKPTTVKCKDTTICIVNGYGGAGAETDPMCTVPSYNSDPFAATDNCTPANLIEFRWELDVNNDGGVPIKSGAKRTNFKSSEVPGGLVVGVHKLYVISEDNCGQEDTTSCLITVKDCKKPTPYCYNGIATVVMPTTQSVVVWAKDLDAGSYDNCTKRADLTFTFGSNSQSSDTFSCADIANGIEQQVVVDIYVTDQAGNKDYCRTYLLIQDGSGFACEDKSAIAGSIAGKVATETTEPVENVLLEVKSTGGIPTFKTDSKGSYAFSNLDMKGDYSITPKRDDDPSNGVSTIDLVLIQKHILGVQPLNSAYKVIAADADRSNDVSAVDLVELRKLILTVYDKLPSNTSWRFVPKTYSFSNISTPWGFPEKVDIKGLSKDELNRDFVGVKVGDVNATAVAHSLLGAEARSGGQTLKFTTLDRELKAGEEAVIEFTAENFSGIEGYQFSLAMKGLDLKSVQSGVLKVNESNFGVTKLGQGYVTTSWNESKGITAGSNDVLFSIKVKATKATTLSESLVINSKYTRAEAYNNSEALNVSLEVGSKKSVAGYALHQNTPNPFKATTVIGYELAKAGSVTMRITDVTGKLVRMYNQDGAKGYNQFKVNRGDVSGAGVLYYTIETKDFSATKKMIVVE